MAQSSLKYACVVKIPGKLRQFIVHQRYLVLFEEIHNSVLLTGTGFLPENSFYVAIVTMTTYLAADNTVEQIVPLSSMNSSRFFMIYRWVKKWFTMKPENKFRQQVEVKQQTLIVLIKTVQIRWPSSFKRKQALTMRWDIPQSNLAGSKIQNQIFSISTWNRQYPTYVHDQSAHAS